MIYEHSISGRHSLLYIAIACIVAQHLFIYLHLQDRHIDVHSNDGEPVLDPSQDYVLLSGHENSSHTILRFKRKLNTCDEKFDVPITVSPRPQAVEVEVKNAVCFLR